MQSRRLAPHPALMLGIAFAAGPAHAATVIIEPDNYTGNISNVAPGATLSTFRYDNAGGHTTHPVYSILGGSWTPTGTRVFGHRTFWPSETSHHWDALSYAYQCEHDNDCFIKFYVFRVDFDAPTTTVKVLTTIRGEMAMDGVELQAFNSNGERLLRCRVHGVDQGILNSGVYPNPQYYSNANGYGGNCGTIVQIKNCSGSQPGNCDYVVEARVQRRQKDIAYVWFGGNWFENSWANVDKLTYILD